MNDSSVPVHVRPAGADPGQELRILRDAMNEAFTVAQQCRRVNEAGALRAAQQEQLLAMYQYVDALEARGLPVPVRLRQEVNLLHSVVASLESPAMSRPAPVTDPGRQQRSRRH